MSDDRTLRAVDEAALARVITAGWKHVKQDGSPLALARHILRSGVLRDADEVRREATATCEHDDLIAQGFHEGWNTGRAELRAAIEAFIQRHVDDAWPPTPDELRTLLADDGAELREHDLHVISDAERRMFGTTDPGEYIEIADGIPVSEFRRLLWEPYRDTADGGWRMSTESIVCMDPDNCPREHVGGMGGTPVHLPADGVVVPGHFDHGVPSDAKETDDE